MPILLRLFALLLLYVFVELSLLVWLGQRLGVLTTVAVVLGAGVAGAAVARVQGVQTLWRIAQESRAGHVPADSVLDGLLILVAGFLLLLPGLLSDVAGLLLVLPPVRRLARGWVKRRFKAHGGVVRSGFTVWTPDGRRLTSGGGDVIDPDVIEGEVVRPTVHEPDETVR